MTTTSETTTADEITTESAFETTDLIDTDTIATDMIDTTKEIIKPEIFTTPIPSSSELILSTSTRFHSIVPCNLKNSI